MDKIKIINELKDLKQVVKVFQDPPFSEPLTEKDILEEFTSYQNHGVAYGYYDEDEILGYIGILKGIQHNHPIYHTPSHRVLYINGIATLRTKRKHGVGSSLLNYAITSIDPELYNLIYLRTNAEGSMLNNIAYANGFKDLTSQGKLVTQEVTFERINGEIGTDQRKFMIKSLTKGNK